METVELCAGLSWHPIRPLLGVRAIGVSAYSAGEPGETVIEPHSSPPRAADTRSSTWCSRELHGSPSGGDEVAAEAGTLVLVRPATHRAAVASAPDTLVLAVGGPPTFEPAGSEWLELARPHFESDPERAAALLDRGIEEIPGSAAIPVGRALLAATHGRDEEALSWLREAIGRDPRLRRGQARGAACGARHPFGLASRLNDGH